MPNNINWITTRITQAQKDHAVTEAVAARLDELLNGQLSDRQLSPKELTSVAKTLIEDMIPASAKASTE